MCQLNLRRDAQAPPWRSSQKQMPHSFTVLFLEQMVLTHLARSQYHVPRLLWSLSLSMEEALLLILRIFRSFRSPRICKEIANLL